MKKIIIIIEGGVCQGVYTNGEIIEIGLLDRDNLKACDDNDLYEQNEKKGYINLENEIKGKEFKQIF